MTPRNPLLELPLLASTLSAPLCATRSRDSLPFPPQGPEWVLFNDFSVSACPAHEVTATYANQKLPCLLYYKQVRQVQLCTANTSAPC